MLFKCHCGFIATSDVYNIKCLQTVHTFTERKVKYPKKGYLFVTTSLQISEEWRPASSIIYHAWQTFRLNRLYVFTFLDLTDHISSLWDNHRQSLKSTPCSRGHNHKSSTDWSLIQTFPLHFSPPTATVLLSRPQAGSGPSSYFCPIICLGLFSIFRTTKAWVNGREVFIRELGCWWQAWSRRVLLLMKQARWRICFIP